MIKCVMAVVVGIACAACSSHPTANPEVLVRVQGGAFWAEPQTLEGDEYARMWAALIADRPYYADYQTRTDRRIPLVRLVELRPA